MKITPFFSYLNEIMYWFITYDREKMQSIAEIRFLWTLPKTKEQKMYKRLI